ncbi:hypothetical protein [Candidatus Poriferisodalis sp.]|uniref:hypothetical protein n=1 Tax=Candidatus Poriferisodalis sp. TaxID=3101277 RepID=UPI003B5C6620
MAAPDLVAAQRAAGAILDAGVGTVLLYGSLAQGEAINVGDIDLVAIYDDLDYDERWIRRCALKARARAAAGCGRRRSLRGGDGRDSYGHRVSSQDDACRARRHCAGSLSQHP